MESEYNSEDSFMESVLDPSDSYNEDSNMEEGVYGAFQVWQRKGGGCHALKNYNIFFDCNSYLIIFQEFSPSWYWLSNMGRGGEREGFKFGSYDVYNPVWYLYISFISVDRGWRKCGGWWLRPQFRRYTRRRGHGVETRSISSGGNLELAVFED